MKKQKLTLTPFEKVWYIICGVFGLWGLTYIVLGLFAKYLPIPSDKNGLAMADSALKSVFGMGFFGWGLVIFITSAVAAVICLCIVAKKTDRDFEKAQRRAARLNRANSFEKEPEVVDAKFEEK